MLSLHLRINPIHTIDILRDFTISLKNLYFNLSPVINEVHIRDICNDTRILYSLRQKVFYKNYGFIDFDLVFALRENEGSSYGCVLLVACKLSHVEGAHSFEINHVIFILPSSQHFPKYSLQILQINNSLLKEYFNLAFDPIYKNHHTWLGLSDSTSLKVTWIFTYVFYVWIVVRWKL